jgi:signal transduction histidine kinase
LGIPLGEDKAAAWDGGACGTKKHSLKFKLSLSYAVMALLLVASVSLISNLFFRSQFNRYMIRQQDAKNREIVSQISRQMVQNSGSSRAQALETVGVSALERGVIVKVYDGSGRILWDATAHNGGFCQQMLKNMAAEMQSRSPNFKGEYEEKKYPLMSGVKRIGTVTAGYYGPFFYSANDADFINTLNHVLFGVGLGSLVLAVLLGIYMANRISSPIAHAIGAAENIAKGNYREKIPQASGTLELDRLTASINRLSDELQNQEVLRRRLTTDIAHELRTPLAALQGNVEALIDGVWEPTRERFESCHEEILRLARLVSNLDRLARLEDENAGLRLSEVDLTAAAEKAVRSFEAERMKKKIQVSVSGPPVKIAADADQISRVFVNLFSNALKYTPEGGAVRVTLSEDEKNAAVEVSDTGTGIAREDLPYIFERFYRTDRSRSSRSGGAGIGLAIVKAIVEMHHGTISARSAVGKGTVFRVVLPRNQP